MADVESAEKEASEVLHLLLSVPRVEPSLRTNNAISSATEEEGSSCVSWELAPVYTTAAETDGTDGGDIETNRRLSQDGIRDTMDSKSTLIKASPKKTVKKKTKLIPKISTAKVEDNAHSVRERFQQGCDCREDCCFRGLNPEAVYRHRLNIAELTKDEHDLYLMGLTMACLGDPGATVKHKARQRIRSSYLHQGRKVCLSAFLYLENCTLYQLKRIRKHLVTHGVVPRVHGNHGKKPHNVFSLDIYQRATSFIKEFVEKYSHGNIKTPVFLPPEISRKTVHEKYQEFVTDVAPKDEKVMGYSTFRHFMKEQFPQLRFCRNEIGPSGSGTNPKSTTITVPKSYYSPSKSKQDLTEGEIESIPIVLAEGQAYLIAPIQDVESMQF